MTTRKDENGNLLPIEEQELEEGNLKNAVINSSSSSKKILSEKY